MLRTVERGAYLSADCMYIYKCNIIKCTKSGYLLPDHATVKAEYEFIGEYTFNEPNGKICTTYLSNEEGYDRKTHERLGQYIRNLRDMYGLNLTPLYNCFSNNILANHYIDPHKIARTDIDIKAEIKDYNVDTDPLEVHGNIINKTTQTHNTIIYRIPIRFNQDYTICIENHGLTTIMPAFLQYDTLMKWSNVKYGQDIDVTNKFNKLHHTQQVVNKSGLRFNHPIKFRVDNVPCRKRIKYFNSTNDGSFTSVVIGQNESLHSSFFGFNGNGQCASHRLQMTIQRQLAHNIIITHLVITFDLLGSYQNSYRQIQIIGSSLLTNVGRRHIDDDFLTWDFEAIILQSSINSLLAFLDGTVGQTDKKETDARFNIHFYRDGYCHHTHQSTTMCLNQHNIIY